MSLFERLQEDAAGLRERIQTHPFVLGLGDGTLPGDRYQFYLRQDYRFLVEYCRVLALGVARADDLATAARLADVLNLTLNTEMDLHRETCWAAGVAPEVLEDTRPAPATVAYTNHLRLVAETMDLAAILAAVLPCAHGYWEVARRLRAAGLPEHQPLYANWIRMYTSEEYAAMAQWMAGAFDDLTADLPLSREPALRDVFLASQRHEYLFWEMAWRMEEWSI
ncbi:MAG TPA: thiaminase II [bacterium]|nr:thiaminase II [bacterium]